MSNHSITAIKMPGANCSMYGCSTSRKNKDISIFRVTRGKDEFSLNWRKKLESVITRDRVLDENLRRQIENQTLYICQLHFSEDSIYYGKLLNISFCVFIYEIQGESIFHT